MLIALYVALGIAVLLYVGAPLAIYFKFTIKVFPAYEVVPVDAMPPEVYEHFGRTAQELAPLGFEVRLYVRVPDQVEHTQAFLGFWVNEAAGQMANAVVIYAQAPNVPLSVKSYVEFLTKPVNGPGVVTNNSSDLGAFRKVRESDTLWARGVTEVDELYRLHLSREARLCDPHEVRYVTAPGEDLAMVVNGNEVSVLRQVRVGFLKRSATPDVLRPTLLGAFGMTLALLPPFLQGRRLRAASRLRAERRRAALAASPPRGVRITHTSPYDVELWELRAAT